MLVGVAFICASLLYSILLLVVYFGKERLNNIENKIYQVLVRINVVGLILELLCCFFLYHMDASIVYASINIAVNKLFLIYLLTWEFVFTAYIYAISFDVKNKIVSPKLIVFYVVTLLFMLLLPLYYYNDGHNIYSYGPATDFLLGVGSIFVLFDIYCVLKNLKRIRDKKYYPLFVLLFLMVFVVLIRYFNPNLLLINSTFAFVTFLMYFTIENPDITVINELKIARRQAEAANEAKTDFLSNMSHEIRTPLNAIVGFSHILLEEDVSDEAKDEIHDILSASDSLLEIVNGILDISKIEANKLEIINTKYYPSEIFEELVKLIRARIGTKPLTLETVIAPDIPNVLYGDSVRLKQIILNLLTNSVKYTKEGKITFKVDCVRKDDICRLIISVEDTGIGIKKENIDKLFTKFERFGVEEHITIEGTGLGLAITKKLVDLMNGKIVVHSVYGKGSCFTVAIDQKILPDEAKETIEVLDVEPNFDGDGRKVLVVDDNRINLKMASKLLSGYDVTVITATSGEEALKHVAEERYDLIFLDDMMPHMSGVEVLQKLKEDESFHTPVIVFTANALTGMKDKYLKDGFDDYLAKPIDRKELEKVLKTYLKGER